MASNGRQLRLWGMLVSGERSEWRLHGIGLRTTGESPFASLDDYPSVKKKPKMATAEMAAAGMGQDFLVSREHLPSLFESAPMSADRQVG